MTFLLDQRYLHTTRPPGGVPSVIIPLREIEIMPGTESLLYAEPVSSRFGGIEPILNFQFTRPIDTVFQPLL
jgi:hypothetical protein